MDRFQGNPAPYPQNTYPPQQQNSSLEVPLNQDSAPQQHPQNPQYPQYPQYPQHPQQNPQYPQPYPQAGPFNPAGGPAGYLPPAQFGAFPPVPGAENTAGSELKTMWRYQLQDAESKLDSGFIKCYQVYNCLLVALFGLFTLLIGLAMFDPYIVNIAVLQQFLFGFLLFGVWNVVQHLMGFLSVMQKGAGKAACAFWMNLIYIIVALICIIGGLTGLFTNPVVYDPYTGNYYRGEKSSGQTISSLLMCLYGLAHICVNVVCSIQVKSILNSRAEAEEKLNIAGGLAEHSFSDQIYGGNPQPQGYIGNSFNQPQPQGYAGNPLNQA